MTYTARFDRIPPRLCRLLARSSNGLRLMTEEEICERSGLSRVRVVQISHMASWSLLRLSDIEAFSHACGVNLLQPKKHLRFLRHRNLSYLDRATVAQRKMLAKLMAGITPPARAQAIA